MGLRMNELEQQIDELYCLYGDIKNEIRRKDKRLYERWRSGGFLIDEDIMSMYPNLSQCLEKLKEQKLLADDNDDEEESYNY